MSRSVVTRHGWFRALIAASLIGVTSGLVLQTSTAATQMENALVAIVNDEAVTQLDLEAALFDQSGSDLVKQSQDERTRAGLQQLIEERLILQAAKQAKVTVDDKLVEDRLAVAARRFHSEDEFEKALVSEGLTRGMLRKRYRDQLMMQKVIEQDVRSKIVVTPSEISRYYEQHPEEMSSAPRVRARHILVRVTPERSEAEALSTVEGLRRNIANGTSFADAAKESSEGPEAAQGGDLGWVVPGHLRPELDNVLFQMAEGIVSEPIRSSIGYHLLVVEERDAVRTWAFEEVEASIREKLLRQKFEKRLAQWLADLRAKAYVVIKLPSSDGASTSPTL